MTWLSGQNLSINFSLSVSDQLTEEIGKLEDKVECANNALKADWERWRQNMRNDIKSAFSDMAERNVQYYEQVIRDSGIASCIYEVISSCTFCLSCAGRVLREQVSCSKASWRLGAKGLAG